MNDRSCKKVSNRILTASSLAYFGEPLIGRLGGEGVERGHVDDIPCVLGRELRVRVGGGVGGVVGSVWVGEIAHEGKGRRKRKGSERKG